MTEPFWNLTNGVRVTEPIPGLYADICRTQGHTYDDAYGPHECARCGFKTPELVRVRSWLARQRGRLEGHGNHKRPQ